MTPPIEQIIGWTPLVDEDGDTGQWVTPDGAIRQDATADDLASWLLDRGVDPSVTCTRHDVTTFGSTKAQWVGAWRTEGVRILPQQTIIEALTAAVRTVAGQ